MGVEVLAENVEGGCDVLRMFGNDVEVGIGFNETAWRGTYSGCGGRGMLVLVQLQENAVK